MIWRRGRKNAETGSPEHANDVHPKPDHILGEAYDIIIQAIFVLVNVFYLQNLMFS